MEIELDKYQKEAVYSEDNNVLVVAAPGSGKTTVILNRVFYLVNIKKINPNNIIVITFTKAAAKSMKNRYLRLLENMHEINKKVPFFGTLHGLFYKILKNHYGKINIVEENVAYRLIGNTLKNYLDSVSDEKIKEVINFISKFKTSGEDLENCHINIDKKIFMHCYNVYEEYKKENRVMDFDDLEIKCKELLTTHRNILDMYRGFFKYMLVDEFQDCDSIQIYILKLLSKGNHVFAVGDEDQCIYGFRGARPEYMVNFQKHFFNGNKKYLKTNYRSPVNIVEMSNKVISNNKIRNVKKVEGVKSKDNNINLINTFDENQQAAEINNIIQKLVNIHKYKYEDIAILYRTNVESRSLIDEFIRKSVPFKFLDKSYNFFQHFICKDILAYLKLSINNRDKNSFVKIINKPFRYISKVIINQIKDNKEQVDLFEYLKSIDEIPIFQLKVIDRLKKDINYLNIISLESAINYIMVAIGYNEYLRKYSSKFKIPMEELEEIVEEFKLACKDYKNINEFLCHVESVEENIKNSNEKEKNGIILSTIHGVKGMEFENVFLINCNEGLMPHSNNNGDALSLEEERRLFYVAITRTIDNIWLCITENIKGNRRRVSRFIDECSLQEQKNKDYIREGMEVVHKVFGKGKIIEVGDNYLSIMFNDEIKRKFDTILTLNSGLLKVQ